MPGDRLPEHEGREATWAGKGWDSDKHIASR